MNELFHSNIIYVSGIGLHELPFAFPLPTDLPSSFKGSYGSILYYAEVVINHFKQIPIDIKIIIDLFSYRTAVGEFFKFHLCLNFVKV